jgi:hypothetical protein
MNGAFHSLQTFVSDIQRDYRGPELRSHFILETFKIRGSALVAFQGGCRVETGSLVDLEDRMESETIQARQMMHVMGEFFGMTLREGVLWQRWWIACFAQCLRSAAPKLDLHQQGNDLFLVDGGARKKLSVSIVTATPVSVVMHFGVNVDPAGAPVAAIGLREMGLSDRAVLELIESFFEVAKREWDAAAWACAKVRPVG